MEGAAEEAPALAAAAAATKAAAAAEASRPSTAGEGPKHRAATFDLGEEAPMPRALPMDAMAE